MAIAAIIITFFYVALSLMVVAISRIACMSRKGLVVGDHIGLLLFLP